MRTSRKWLEQYVDLHDLTLSELAKKSRMPGWKWNLASRFQQELIW